MARHKQYKESRIWIQEKRRRQQQAMATQLDEGTFKRLHDENVGSYLISAPFEAWQAVLADLRQSNQAQADTVTTLLRESGTAPSPGAVIEIEVMPGTESDELLDTICSLMPLEQIDGEYQRKAKTTRKTAKVQSGGGGDPTATKGSKKATPRECMCGCGEMTGGGKFRPGHDARFKGQMIKLIDAGGPEGEAAIERLREHPNLVNIRDMEARLGSGPAKEAAKLARLEKMKADKEAAKAAKAAEEVE